MPAVAGVPGWIVALLLPILISLGARAAVDIVHVVLKLINKDLGTNIQEPAGLDDKIEQFVKLSLPGYLKLVAGGHMTFQDVVQTTEDSIKALHPTADTSTVAAHILDNMPDTHVVTVMANGAPPAAPLKAMDPPGLSSAGRDGAPIP